MPIYNAEPYLVQAIEGILHQTYPNWELIICDNQSTDSSAQIAKQYASQDLRIRFYQNQWNIGFSGNAHKTTSLAQGDFVILHAGDDIAIPNAFAEYVKVINEFKDGAESLILISDFDIVNQSGQFVKTVISSYPTTKATPHEQRTKELPEYITYDGHAILKEKLYKSNTFGWVGTVLFAKDLMLKTEGYSSNQWVNPDKLFMFKVLSLNPRIIWLRAVLFRYRIHNFNQNSQQTSTGVLKYLLDQYAYTFDLPEKILKEYAQGRQALIEQFIEHDCMRAALREISLGNRKFGFRHLCFGLATYPDVAWKNPKTHFAIMLWLLGPIGRWLGFMLYRGYMRSNPDNYKL
jgi:glycosyltransferase involved in cell wall biosynthesis